MSPDSFSFHPDAIEEALSAAQWYHERSPIAAGRFVAALHQVIDNILGAPHRWPISACGTRKVKLPRFPYLVIYRATEHGILI
jgi:plasmid stabilization system protein ParE